MNDLLLYEEIYSFMEMIVSRYGVLGIGAAMFAESAGVPFAASVLILLSGPMILTGKASFWAVLLASTIGITLGSMFSYCIGLIGHRVGKAIKRTFINRLNTQNNFTKTETSQKKSRALWARYGNFSIFMAQLWGVSRTFISLFAGAIHMKFLVFVIYTFFGAALFSLLAIGVSIVLTTTLSASIKVILSMIEKAPWLVIVLPILLAALVYVYYKKKHTLSGIIIFYFTRSKKYLINLISRNNSNGRIHDRNS